MKQVFAFILLLHATSSAAADLAFTLLVDVSGSFQPAEKSTYCAASSVVAGELLALAEKGEPIAITMRTVGANNVRPSIHMTRVFGTGNHSAKRAVPGISAWLCSIPQLVARKKIQVSPYETALFAAISDVASTDFTENSGTLVIISDGINHSAIYKGEAHLQRGTFPSFPAPPTLRNVRVVGLGFGQGVSENLEPLFNSRWTDYFSQAGASLVTRKFY